MLSATDLRHKFILNNIANSKTPGYMARDLDFTEFLKKFREDAMTCEIERTNEKHLPYSDLDDSSPFHLDGAFTRQFINYKESNQEEEMANLAMNSLTYKAAADLLSRKYQIMSTAITGSVR